MNDNNTYVPITTTPLLQPPITQPTQPCPHCGYCPHCGRSGSIAQPYIPTHPIWQIPMTTTTGVTFYC